MKKRTRKLTLTRETVKALSAAALEQAIGGRIQEVMTGDPTDCICPSPRLRRARFDRILEFKIRK